MPALRRSKRLQSADAGSRKARKTLRTNNSPTQQTEGVQIPRQLKRKINPTYLHRSQAEIEADPNRSLRLLRVPREIVDEIISHLPPAAVVCLTLSCKHALNTLGTDSWAEFRGRSRLYYGSNGSLVELLQRDHPGHEYCLRCETMHPPLKPPHAHRTTKFTKLCFGQEASIDYWPQTSSGTYSVVWEHIAQAFAAKPTNLTYSLPIDLFSGDFTFQRGSVAYRLCSSARWADRNFIIFQEHRLRSSIPGSVLQAVDVTSLPIRVCAHLSTTTAPPGGSRTPIDVKNGPLITHAIATAFPEKLRRKVPPASTFRKASPAEQAQMTASVHEKDMIWHCRSCPTKFGVTYHEGNGGELVVTVWHCFGRELYKALEYWRFFVRREGPNLGPKKRNSEYYVMTRSLPDFKIE